MIYDKLNPYQRSPIEVSTRQLLHEGRQWLECEGLIGGLPDPHTWEDIARHIQRFYTGGLSQLKYDLGHVWPDTFSYEYEHVTFATRKRRASHV